MNDLAARLWTARKNGGVVPVEEIAEPQTLEEAYAIQAETVRLSGHPVLGFKVGSTSREAQQLLGTSEPGSCPVPAPYIFECPARIGIETAQMPAVEGEFAFRLGRDLPPRAEAYDHDDLTDAIDAVAGAVEVVGTRIAGGLAGRSRFLLTADCRANIGIVLGAWSPNWRKLDLKAHRVAMIVNGATRGEGEGARALGDPLNVMVWLANQQSQRGVGLQQGMCVSTGTCTGLDKVEPGDRVVAEFCTLGAVEIEFE